MPGFTGATFGKELVSADIPLWQAATLVPASTLLSSCRVVVNSLPPISMPLSLQPQPQGRVHT